MSRAHKIEILQRIATGKLKVNDLPKPIEERNYTREHVGLFKCEETGEYYTLDQIDEINRKIPINHWFFFVTDEKNEKNEVVKIKQRKLSTSTLLEDFGENEFLELMKEANKTKLEI